MDQSLNVLQETLRDRGNTYGHFAVNGALMQALKDQARATPGWGRMEPHQREAMDMILHKVARILNGDPSYADSWLDIAGYAQLVVDILAGKH